MAGISFEMSSLPADGRERIHDHCVLEGTEQAWFRVRLRNICGTRSKQKVLPNVRSIQKSIIDQGFCEVGGTRFEPVTPAL
jgi:hypothetical protein